MYFKATTLVLIGLTLIKGGQAQDTVSIALVGFDSDGASDIAGEIIGTGADGTTFVLSETATDDGSLPFTLTVVQGASQVSEVVSVASGVGAVAQCTYDAQGVGVCSFVVEGAADGSATGAETTIISGTIPMLAVPVTTASGVSVTQATNSGSTSATQSSSGPTTSPSSGAARNLGAIGLGAILPLICAAFII